MVEIQLSQNFRLAEFTKSATARARGIDNTPTDSVIVSLAVLTQNILQPLREHYGHPITISSGYRCPELNKAVGGSTTSQHMLGEAADLHLPNLGTGREWFEWIKTHCTFHQLIWEHDASGTYWIHVSCRRNPSQNKRQIINELLKK